MRQEMVLSHSCLTRAFDSYQTSSKSHFNYIFPFDNGIDGLKIIIHIGFEESFGQNWSILSTHTYFRYDRWP